MIQRNTLKSKSFWTGLAMIVTGVGLCVMGDGLSGAQTIAGGLAAIFVRDAIAKLETGAAGV